MISRKRLTLRSCTNSVPIYLIAFSLTRLNEGINRSRQVKFAVAPHGITWFDAKAGMPRVFPLSASSLTHRQCGWDRAIPLAAPVPWCRRWVRPGSTLVLDRGVRVWIPRFSLRGAFNQFGQADDRARRGSVEYLRHAYRGSARMTICFSYYGIRNRDGVDSSLNRDSRVVCIFISRANARICVVW